jgi:hypothetical protein
MYANQGSFTLCRFFSSCWQKEPTKEENVICVSPILVLYGLVYDLSVLFTSGLWCNSASEQMTHEQERGRYNELPK